MFPFDIQKKLYADSNYLGLGIDNPVVKRMYSTMESREKNLYKPNGVVKNLIFDKNGIAEFIRTGRASDHVPVLRNLTHEESCFSLKKLLDNSNTNIYVLKEAYCINNIECVLFESNSLVVYDPSFGYWDNYSEISIKNKKMLRIMRDFVNEEIIKYCCYSSEESKNIILSLIS